MLKNAVSVNMQSIIIIISELTAMNRSTMPYHKICKYNNNNNNLLFIHFASFNNNN